MVYETDPDFDYGDKDATHLLVTLDQDQFPGIVFQWLMFGHSQQLHQKDQPLATRFTWRSNQLDIFTKHMFSCQHTFSHYHLHYAGYEGFGNLAYAASPKNVMKVSEQ